MPLTLVRPRLMQWAGNSITDHNRTPLSIVPQRIETKNRMANGTARKYFIADKHTFSCSWTELPSLSTQTVDGYWGGDAMYNFYLTTPGSFTLRVSPKTAGTYTDYLVQFVSFEHSIEKRWKTHELWSASVTLEEI